jgi:hypothetical protein
LDDPRLDPTIKFGNALVIAAENGRLETVKLLLKDPRVNCTAQNNSAVIIAAERGHEEVVQELLKIEEVRHMLYKEQEAAKIQGKVGEKECRIS